MGGPANEPLDRPIWLPTTVHFDPEPFILDRPLSFRAWGGFVDGWEINHSF